MDKVQRLRLQHFPQRHADRISQFFHVVHRDVSFAAFNLTNISPVKSSVFSQRFLR